MCKEAINVCMQRSKSINCGGVSQVLFADFTQSYCQFYFSKNKIYPFFMKIFQIALL